MIAELSDHASEYTDAQFQQLQELLWGWYNAQAKAPGVQIMDLWNLAKCADNYILAVWNLQTTRREVADAISCDSGARH